MSADPVVMDVIISPRPSPSAEVVHAVEHLARGHVVFVSRSPVHHAEVSPETAKAIIELELPIEVEAEHRCLRVRTGGRDEVKRWVNLQPL